MFSNSNCASVPLVANIDGNGNNGGWADGGWLWIIVVFALLFGWGNGGFGGFGAGQGRQNYSEDEQHMMAAMNYIRARRYNEALNVLNGISNHNAAWYYYSSIANMGLGNNNVALEQAKQAMDMEPGNMQYRQYYQQLQNGGGFYGGSPFGSPFGGGYGGGGSYGGYGSYGGGYDSCGTGNLCCDLWCADTLCECMGGDLCSCM